MGLRDGAREIMAVTDRGQTGNTAGWLVAKGESGVVGYSCKIAIQCALAAVLLLLCWTSVSASESSSPVVVITNKDVSEKSLNLGALRSVFGMRLRSWMGGKPVRVFVFSDHHPLHIEFSKKILGVFPHQLRWSWDRLVFSGTGQAPVYVTSEAQMLELVSVTPGAIGYLTRGKANGQIKVLPIITH